MGRSGRGESKTSPRRVNAQARAYQAMKLRRDGLTYQQIADKLGYKAANGAYSAVRRVLDKIDGETKEIARDIRMMEFSRLDCAHEAIFPKVQDGNLEAIKTMLKLMERRSKLMGLDAPARSEVSGPDGGPIERRTTTVTQLDRDIEELTQQLVAQGKDSDKSEVEATTGDGS